MLYIPQNRKVTIKIPRVSAEVATADTLHLRSTIDLSLVAVAVEVIAVSELWLLVSVVLPPLQFGEYQYEVLSGGVVVSRGLAIVQNKGDFSPSDFNIDFYTDNVLTKQYDEKETYIQHQ